MDITVSLKVSGLSGVTVFGTADFAMNRDQAVTVTTLTAEDIQERIGNLELPEMLNATPVFMQQKQVVHTVIPELTSGGLILKIQQL